MSTPCIGGVGETNHGGGLERRPRRKARLFFQISDNCLRARANLQLFKNSLDMPMDGPDTDAHGLRNFLVDATLA